VEGRCGAGHAPIAVLLVIVVAPCTTVAATLSVECPRVGVRARQPRREGLGRQAETCTHAPCLRQRCPSLKP